MADLIAPFGGTLKELYLSEEARSAERERLKDYPSWDLSERQLCDLELLLCGAFSPLEGFLCRADYDRVCAAMRLTDGTFWPMPITLDVTATLAEQLTPGARLALRDPEGVPVAALEVEDLWQPDRHREAISLYGHDDAAHPGVSALLDHAHPVYVGGRVHGIDAPAHYDFRARRHTPRELRAVFDKLGWRRVVALHTSNPLHRAHQVLAQRAVQRAEANLLLHASVGEGLGDQLDYFSRVRCYERMLRSFPEQTTMLSVVPLATRRAGAREVLWHAIVRRNYGCSHMAVGPNHAGVSMSGGESHHGEVDRLLSEHRDELGIEVLVFPELVYVPEREDYVEREAADAGDTVMTLSSGEFRRRLRAGEEIPAWFMQPDIVAELRRTYRPRHRQGFTVFLTGLSGAGKSTIANALRVKLLELGGRPVTLLDGDIVRKNLSSELGFSKEHRDLNILRIGFVASEITKNGGIAICAPIAPYRQTRRRVREMIEPLGGMIEVHVATSLAVCEARDRKGLYAKARAGLIQGFTGIDDPYEIPENPELRVDTVECSPDEAAQRIILKLESLGFIR